MVVCPNCGFDAGSSKFCPECGTKMGVDDKPRNFCPNCGTDVGSSKFCPECGTKMGVDDKPRNFCPNCGTDVGSSKFCPECGTKIGGENEIKTTCPRCGNKFNPNVKSCPYCGWSKYQNIQEGFDKIVDVDTKISSKISGVLGKSETVDKFFDKTASLSREYANGGDNAISRKQWEILEPVFLEALDTIEDDFVKLILMTERNILGAGGGSITGVGLSSVFTPTRGMSHDEAIAFYQEWADNIAKDIEKEKQKGTFNEDKFYKERLKAGTLENVTIIGIPKSFKDWRNDHK